MTELIQAAEAMKGRPGPFVSSRGVPLRGSAGTASRAEKMCSQHRSFLDIFSPKKYSDIHFFFKQMGIELDFKRNILLKQVFSSVFIVRTST